MKRKLKFKIISCNNLATYFNNKEGNNINKCDIKRLIDLITQKLSFPKQNLTKKTPACSTQKITFTEINNWETRGFNLPIFNVYNL